MSVPIDKCEKTIANIGGLKTTGMSNEELNMVSEIIQEAPPAPIPDHTLINSYNPTNEASSVTGEVDDEFDYDIPQPDCYDNTQYHEEDVIIMNINVGTIVVPIHTLLDINDNPRHALMWVYIPDIGYELILVYANDWVKYPMRKFLRQAKKNIKTREKHNKTIAECHLALKNYYMQLISY